MSTGAQPGEPHRRPPVSPTRQSPSRPIWRRAPGTRPSTRSESGRPRRRSRRRRSPASSTMWRGTPRRDSPRRALSARCRIEGSSGLVHAPRARHRRALPGSRRLRAAPAGFRDRRLPGRRVRARSLPEEFGRKERGRGTVFLPRACTRPRRDVGEDGGRKESGRPIGPIGAGRGVRGRARRPRLPGRRMASLARATPPPSGAGRPLRRQEPRRGRRIGGAGPGHDREDVRWPTALERTFPE